jgi:hypothetical protein
MAKRKGLELRIDGAVSTAEVYADADRLVQVLTNLLGNAVKFTKAGWVGVSLRLIDGDVECSVSDTGPGIAEADMPKVFGKFMQFGRTYGAGEKGTGLGLAIARNIVQLHQGRIWAESKQHEGSRFTFRLPCYSDELVLTLAIGERIVAAREAQKELMLFLVRIDAAPGDPHDKDWAGARKRVIDRIAEAGLMRGSDLTYARGERDIVLLACLRPADLPAVRNRWEAQLGKTLAETARHAGVRSAYGVAVYPLDGDKADVLVAHAELGLLKRDQLDTVGSAAD